MFTYLHVVVCYFVVVVDVIKLINKSLNIIINKRTIKCPQCIENFRKFPKMSRSVLKKLFNEVFYSIVFRFGKSFD